jgi:hypothetical protein
MSGNRLTTMTRGRTISLVILLCALVLTELGRELYRPYIFQRGIQDFGLAAIVGNLFGTIAIIFFGIAVLNANRRASLVLTAVVTVVLILYEIVQHFVPGAMLDWRDIVATLVGGGIAYLFVRALPGE